MSPVAVFAVDKTMPMGDHHSMSPASQELMSGMKSMHNDMMAGVMSSDPDVAFAKGMIAHHQGAIQMSETQLKFGRILKCESWQKILSKPSNQKSTRCKNGLKTMKSHSDV